MQKNTFKTKPVNVKKPHSCISDSTLERKFYVLSTTRVLHYVKRQKNVTLQF